MAINRISGNILQDNLQRGNDLSFQGNLVYIDVQNNRVGVKTSTPQDDFNVIGTANVANVRITSATANGIFVANAAKLAVTSNNLQFNGTTLTLIGTANVTNVDVSGNISTAGNIGTGNINISGQVTAVGNISGNNISAVGTVSAGNVLATGNVSGNNMVATGTVEGTALDITGSAIISVSANIANIVLSGTAISADTGILDLGSNANVSITGGAADFVLSTDGAGNLIWIDGANIVGALGNLSISNTTISTALVDGNITLTPTGNGTVIIDTTTGLTIPVGNTVQRADPAATGTVRFNTDAGRIEVYDGAEWDSVAAGVTNQLFTGDDSTLVFALDRDSTSAAALVVFNGVVQIPGVAYTVTGNLITFAEAPLTSDVIDVRFL